MSTLWKFESDLEVSMQGLVSSMHVAWASSQDPKVLNRFCTKNISTGTWVTRPGGWSVFGMTRLQGHIISAIVGAFRVQGQAEPDTRQQAESRSQPRQWPRDQEPSRAPETQSKSKKNPVAQTLPVPLPGLKQRKWLVRWCEPVS